MGYDPNSAPAARRRSHSKAKRRPLLCTVPRVDLVRKKALYVSHMDYKEPIVVIKTGLVLVYLIAAALVWQGNAALPLEFHDREMFADHERIVAEPSFFFSTDKAQYNGRWLANAYQLAVYWLIGENSPFGYRLLALLLHGAVTALLVRLALPKGCSSLVAHGAGLWFLVTPSHYQVIHHISAVDYILCALFGLWALSRAVANRAWDGWVILGLLCAMLSHQAGVIFAGFCWHAVYWGRWRAGILAAVLVGGPGLALWFSLPASTSGGGAATAFSALLSWQYAWELIQSFIGLFGRLAAFAFFFPLPPNSASNVLVGLGLGGLLATAWLEYRRHPAFSWAIGSVVLCLPFALLINEFLAGLTAGPIRYVYFSSGFAFVTALTLLESLGNWYGRGRFSLFMARGAGIDASLWVVKERLGELWRWRPGLAASRFFARFQVSTQFVPVEADTYAGFGVGPGAALANGWRVERIVLDGETVPL
jgi:hypothetical protein